MKVISILKATACIATMSLLVGCGQTVPNVVPVSPVIVTTKYVVKIPPKELMTLPAKPANVNLATATQKEVANWLVAKEAYTKQLENDLIGIAQFLTNAETTLNAPATPTTQK